MTDAQIAKLQAGQIIVSRTGKSRTIIHVHCCTKYGRKRYSVTVPILHCSWTRRTYTVLDMHQLRHNYKWTDTIVNFKRWKLGRIVLTLAGMPPTQRIHFPMHTRITFCWDDTDDRRRLAGPGLLGKPCRHGRTPDLCRLAG